MALVILLDWYDLKFSIHDILVEFHGLVFDLIVFGIILTIYEKIKSKKDKITRYKEEIEDFRFLNTEESRHRLHGIIKRLLKLEKQKIDLSHCCIYHCPTHENMEEWEFSGAKLYNTHFKKVNFKGSNFYLADFYFGFISGSDFSNCKFAEAILYDVTFLNCTFNNTSFLNAYVNNKDWFINLEKNSNIGVQEIVTNYELSETTITIENKEYFQLIKKGKENKNARDRNELFLESSSSFGIPF